MPGTSARRREMRGFVVRCYEFYWNSKRGLWTKERSDATVYRWRETAVDVAVRYGGCVEQA
jgi:hypothetical protein